MKPLQLLPVVYAASSLACQDGDGHVHLDHSDSPGCGAGSHAVLGFGSDSLCVPDSDYLAADQKILSQQADDSQFQCPNGTCHNDSPAHIWTHSTPCFKSSKSDNQYCVFTDHTFAEGRGTSFVTTAGRAGYLATYPAFSEPEIIKGINQDLVRTIPAVYDMKEFPGKGMGLEAKVDIRRGDLIMANTVSLMIDYRVFDELANDEWMQLQAFAVDYLPAQHRSAILNLSTHDGGNLSHVQRVNKITSTNAFDIDPDTDDVEQDNGFFVVFPEIARMNHDCRANADYYFDHETLTQYIHAIRPIKAGDEITLSYINPRMERDARMQKLQRIWGFGCVCHLCTRKLARAEASDLRIRLINELLPELQNHNADSRATPEMAELLISLHEQEELWGMMYEVYMYAAQEYNGAGDPWTAIKYAQLAVEWGNTAVGPKESSINDMRALADDPWSHWSWMLRTKRRNGWEKRTKDDKDD
ncbi:hypothetical protein B0H66DRAFT_554243 [Apodospora peruviana]|uniref:SET domain-containing protein n=1 Tax=Apodospora peruviana TaxID=516989 RepID=A0AAE0IC25_9PEZI|nr:hypothetical protein B0H66DRAFT_554243 [Apodospora peruviana]